DVIMGFHELIKHLHEEYPTLLTISLTLPMEKALEQILHFYHTGKRIVLLARGDPLFFGLASTLLAHIPPQKLLCIPSLSCLQIACSRLNIPWQNMAHISFHGKTSTRSLCALVRKNQPICILCDAAHPPKKIASFLVERGLSPYYQMHLASQLLTPNERLQSLSLEEAANTSVSHPCTILLTCKKNVPTITLGLPDSLFTQHGYCTKQGIRAQILASLCIAKDHTIWDIGAGSGAVSLEAASLAYEGQVFAIEQNQERLERIYQLRNQLACVNLEIVHTKAPKNLNTLPVADGIFIGGGLSKNQNLFNESLRLLKPGGRLTVSIVLLETLNKCLTLLKTLHLPHTLTQCHISQLSDLGMGSHLKAQNPIFLLTTQKKANTP
ncbi:MAG: precorrin-6y C5,15-methyltransferase (decarboxylating) subunit CbiE, partial [Desulfovibrio sp.]|nr:precorrin-6y C5,15-methyltransferase (decarboxylating) subunit CbiE [Desulfovibrio sp.]